MRESWRRRRRIARCQAQWLGACGLMANVLRAGCNLAQAVQMAAEETPPPLGEELRQVVQDMEVGKSLPAALSDLERRVPGESVATVVLAVEVLSASGGNFVTVFEQVAAVIREQHRVAVRVRTMVAQGVMSGVIVTLLPLALLGIVACAAPTFVRPLWQTGWGRLLAGSAFVLQALGVCWMQRIVRVRV